LRERIAARGDSAVSTYFLTSQLLMLALALAGSGDFPGGLEAIESALGEESAFGMVSHRTAQLLRVKGDILAGLPGAEPGAAQACLNQAMALAQRQGALAWELQAATSLARLYGGQGRTAEARALLGSVYGRFTEGFNTLDLRIAQEVLAGLEGG
jgi:hypothetical protein